MYNRISQKKQKKAPATAHEASNDSVTVSSKIARIRLIRDLEGFFRERGHCNEFGRIYAAIAESSTGVAWLLNG